MSSNTEDKPRVTMWTKVFLFLIITACSQQVTSGVVYISELMVESNVTLDAQRILSSWSAPLNLQVNDTNKQLQTVTLNSSELVAECLVIGDEYSCNCSTTYAWSNEVCYTLNCCNESTCQKNVSLVTSICVPKTSVLINGSIQTSSTLTSANTQTLKDAFKSLNGLNSTKVTSGPSNNIANFEVQVYVRLNTSKLQEILTNLKTALSSGPIFVDTRGMVKINATSGLVNYESQQILNCTFDEPTDSAGWNLSTKNARFELNNGLLVSIDRGCATADCPSCVGVTLKKMTSDWNGTYECGFTIGSVRHTARADIEVALLPDVIQMKFDPLIVDCSDSTKKPNVSVTATIPVTTEQFQYWMQYNSVDLFNLKNTTNTFVFNISVPIDCTKKGHTVTILFQNRRKQIRSQSVVIPALYENNLCCQSDGVWPKTPAGTTLVNTTCPEGRVGYRTRTCNKKAIWEDVFSNCVSVELNKVTNAAQNFLNGLGATQKVAMDIFEGIKNSSVSSNDVADISATIGIIGVMANASHTTDLQEEIFPSVIESASNMVNSSWSEVNDTIRYQMSSNYLTSLENLVKNIKVNTSDGFNSTNLELKFCSSDDCVMSVFDVGVNMSKTGALMKTMAVKNIMEKLNNKKFPGRNHSSVLLSATLVNSSGDNVTIKMTFPDEQPDATERLCVFWDTSAGDWSSEGCVANITEDNQTLCECSHLTAFSVLMSKSANISSKPLDIITYVGLGVSIFSLLVFLLIEYLVWSAVIKTNLSHFRHTAVVNIAVFCLLADCSFLASDSPDRLSDSWCLVLTVCKHLFYLAMFTWMLCLSAMLVHQLIFVFSPVRKRVFMFLSSIVGYVVPIVLVGTSYVYYKYTNKDYYDRKTCWLTYERLLVGSIHTFLLPVGTIILSNLFSMVVVIVTLMKTAVPDSSKADDKETAKSILKVVVFLTPVFGVTWSIGFFLYTIDEKDPIYQVVNYLFTILNSFQGLFILLTGCIAEQKVRDELFRIIMAKTGRETDSMQKLTSTTYTKDK